ncbi:MAG: DUF3168 domain-containing protein [Epsilonproteobacteria bacterium]|nr:DUF3168 domain-containing protein [Campylobacterota bacterium]
MIEKDLYIALKTVCDRVYPIKMPEDAIYPTITYMVIYDGQDQATNGNLMSRSVRFQVDVWASSYSEAKTLKDAIVNEVIGLKGGSISAQDLYEDQLELFRELIDFKIKRT